MGDNIVAIGALVLNLLTIIGAGVAWLSERKRRRSETTGQDINNLIALSKRVTGLEDEREKDYRERQQLQRDLWTSNGRIYLLEQQQVKDEAEREGLKKLLTVAIEYIDVVCDMLVELGGKPPARPAEITEWLNSHEEKGDS